MAALTQDTPIQALGVNLTEPVNYVIATSAQLYVGGIADLTSGKVTPHVPGGLVVVLVVGAAQPGDDPMIYPPADPNLGSIPVGDGTVQAQIETGEVPVLGGDGSIDAITGLAGAITDVGTVVWATNDNLQNLTSVDPGAELAFGVVVGWSSNMGYSVRMFAYTKRLTA